MKKIIVNYECLLHYLTIESFLYAIIYQMISSYFSKTADSSTAQIFYSMTSMISSFDYLFPLFSQKSFAILTHFLLTDGKLIAVDLLDAFLVIFLLLAAKILFVGFFSLSPLLSWTKINGNYSFWCLLAQDLFLLIGEKLACAVPLWMTRQVPSALALFSVSSIKSFIALLLFFLPTFNFFSTYQNSCEIACVDSSCFSFSMAIVLTGSLTCNLLAFLFGG